MKTLLICITGLLIDCTAFSQTANESYRKDVVSIDAIIAAYYEVVSGSGEDPWQYERDKYIHSGKAVITRLDKNGNAKVHSLEAEYIPMVLNPRENFYEKELKRVVSQYGDIAQVWSAFEIRTEPEMPTDIQGLNSIQLHYENGRWYIDSWTTQMESDTNPLVKEFLDNN